MNLSSFFIVLLSLHKVCGHGLEDFTKSLFKDGTSKITVCDSLECESTLFMGQEEDSKDELLVYFPTLNIEIDPYINLYLGWVLDLFKLCDNVDIHVVICSLSHYIKRTASITSENDYRLLHSWAAMNCSVQRSDSVTQLFSAAYCQDFKNIIPYYGTSPYLSPKKIAMVSIQDPFVAINISVLTFRESQGLEGPIFLHLNDEMPWNKSPHDLQTQLFAYQQAFRVFRTVYYDAFQSVSSYTSARSGSLLTSSFLTPLGRDGNEYHAEEVISQVSKASTRPVLCSFAGGLRYSSLGGKESQDRVQMAAAFQNDSYCSLFSSEDAHQESHKLSRYDYIQLMRVTVFVLCPAGLNPETHRPHQALDLGAIPLTLRVAEAEQDYLSGVVWCGVVWCGVV